MAEDIRQTLDIPNGTTFEFKDGKLIFGHETDIVIRTNMGGYKFQKIFSKRGNVQVLPPEGVEFDVDEIEAPNGDVFLNGRVKARHARGKTIHFQEGRLTADLIEATGEIVLAGRQVNVLHVKAPRVTIDPDAEGTCLVIESQNDVGRCKARGGFRSVDEARTAFDQFRQLLGAGAAAQVAAVPLAAAPASMPAQSPRASASPIPEASPIADDANMTYPGLPGTGLGMDGSPVLPKSSVFRKRS
jgi:hypothetical protein